MFGTKTKATMFMLVLLSSLFSSNLLLLEKAAAYQNIIFPIIGASSFSNDFTAPRASGQHNAIDILASKGKKLVSVVDGTIVDVQYPKPSWGYSVTIRADNGYSYTYIHMNDDRPGTNDGKGGGMNAYAADMREGNRVARGQLIGWVGDSGHSNGVSHLHFEMSLPSGAVSNPYQSLIHAKKITEPIIPGRVTDEILPFGRYFKGGANITMGNFDLDPASEFVIGAGRGGGPHIKVYDDNEVLTKGFFAYDPGFSGGVDVATGDVDGDGVDEIITGAGPGGPHVRVFEADGTLVTGFFAYGSSVKNGLKVVGGDVNGDSRDDIIVGLGPGGEPRVKVFDMSSGTPLLSQSFLAFNASFTGGIDVGSGDVMLTSPGDEIVAAAGTGGDPRVRIFDQTGVILKGFFAYPESMRGGVRVSVGNTRTLSPEAEIVTVPAAIGNPQVRTFDKDANLLTSRMFIEEWWIGGYDVGAGYDLAKAVTGTNRRVSVRLGTD